MGRATGRTRQERGLVNMAETVAPSEPDSFDWDPSSEEDDQEFETVSPLSEHDRIITRQKIRRGQLIEFAMMQYALVSGHWRKVARADTCHGELHIHRFERNADDDQFSRVVIRRIETQSDLEIGFEEADAMLEQHWEENVRRWKSGR